MGVEEPHSNWPDAVASAQLALNSAPNDAHGYSPFQVIFGRVAALPADRHFPTQATEPVATPIDDYLHTLRDGLHAACIAISQWTSQKPRPPENPFQPGSSILITAPPNQRGNKLQPRWMGPFTVTRTPNPYQVSYDMGNGERPVHVGDAKPYFSPSEAGGNCEAASPLDAGCAAH